MFLNGAEGKLNIKERERFWDDFNGKSSRKWGNSSAATAVQWEDEKKEPSRPRFPCYNYCYFCRINSSLIHFNTRDYEISGIFSLSNLKTLFFLWLFPSLLHDHVHCPAQFIWKTFFLKDHFSSASNPNHSKRINQMEAFDITDSNSTSNQLFLLLSNAILGFYEKETILQRQFCNRKKEIVACGKCFVQSDSW